MPAFTNSWEALERARVLTGELVVAYGELAMIQAQGIRAHVDAYQQYASTGNLNISTVREIAKSASAMYDQQAIRTQGEIDAALIELRYIDLFLLHITNLSPPGTSRK